MNNIVSVESGQKERHGGAKPLVSFCVKCYNQKDLIVPALEAAFAQTYRPLEIVISDDASVDGTPEVVQEMIDAYRARGGDLPITFVRNDKNLGSIKNWQKCCEIAKGELLVKADGDDISCANRTEEVVSAWLEDDKRSLIVYHDAEKIDKDGRSFGLWRMGDDNYWPLGAIASYSRKLYESFGAIVVDDPLAVDDFTYAYRAILMQKKPLYVNKVLLKYRVGSGVTSGIVGYRKFMPRGMRGEVLAREQLLADIDTCKGVLTEAQKREHRANIGREKESILTQLQLFEGGRLQSDLRRFVN